MTTYEMDAYDLAQPAEYVDTTVPDLRETIETNMWLAEAYDRNGSAELRDECLRAAWKEYTRFQGIIEVYAGADLGNRLREMMVKHDHLLREGNR